MIKRFFYTSDFYLPMLSLKLQLTFNQMFGMIDSLLRVCA